jgi:transposase
MDNKSLFSMALNLQTPWYLDDIEFRQNIKGAFELHLFIKFTKDKLASDSTGILCPVYDLAPEREWQHINFFQYTCIIHCKAPRIKDAEGKVKTISVPWARPNSGFTLLFEAFAMMLIEREMPIKNVAKTLSVYDKRIWRVFNYWVDLARKNTTHKDIAYLGIDETSIRKGHKYVTVAVDMEVSQVIHVIEGKGKDTIKSIAEHLDDQSIDRSQVEEISIDLSPSFIAGAAEHFPQAHVTFDHFHVTKLLSEAFDKVRKTEQQENNFFLKKSKYIFLKNTDNLNEKQSLKLNELITQFPTLGEAYRLKMMFKDFWTLDNEAEAEAFLQDWCTQAQAANIGPFEKFIRTLKVHWAGIIRFATSGLNNAILEGINSKIQLAKRRARGFRNTNNFINMIYFITGKLNFTYPRYPL